MIAVILSLIMTIGIIVLNAIPVAKAPMILVVNATPTDVEGQLTDTIKKYAKHISIKSRNLSANEIDLTYELRNSDGKNLIQECLKFNGVTSASLLNHEGEVSF